jgi:parvulin-like peptidyl-prolyl isomerase
MMYRIKISDGDILEQVKLSCGVPGILEQILVRRILELQADKLGITITADELQERANFFRRANNLYSAKKTIQWLDQYRLSIDELEKMIYFELLNEKVSNYCCEGKIEEYFYEHQAEYDNAVIYEFTLNDPGLADELYYAIREKEISFFDVARKYIQDDEMRRKGGYRGKLHRKDLNPSLSVAVFSAKPPQLLRPIIDANGIHIIYVEEINRSQLNEEMIQHIKSEIFFLFLQAQGKRMEII